MKREIKIGIFLAAIFVIMAVSVFVLGKVGRLFHKSGYTVEVRFDSVAGLDRRAVVRIGGVRVGFVEDISLERSRPLVRIKITRRDVAVPSDSKATLATLGMLGEKYIEILPGESREACRDGGRLEAASSVGLDQIGAEIAEVGKSLREVMSEENRDRVEATLDSLASLTSSLDAFLGQSGGDLRAGIRDAARAAGEARRAIDAISEELHGSAAELRGFLDRNSGLVRTNLEKLEKVLGEVEASVKSLRETLDSLNGGEGALGRLIRDPEMGENVERTAEGAAGAAEAIGSLSGSFEVRSEYYGDSRLVKSGLGVGLGFGKRNLIETRLTHDPWRGAYTYTLQAGRRVGAFVPRAGVIESDFGVGLDYETLGRRLRFSLDTFAFNRDDGPRFRVSTRLFPVEPFFLVAGVDDFSLASGREFYFGLGIEAR